MHINEDQNQQAEIFRDTISGLGLNQHVTFSTHRVDNILNVVMNELTSNVQLYEVKPGPYVLDYLAVLFKLNIIKPNAQKEEVTFGNLKDVYMDAVFSDLKLEVKNYENTDSIVEDLEKKFDELSEKVVQKRQSINCSEKKQPWYNSDTKNQKQVVQNHERIWRKHDMDDTWKAFTTERQKYNCMLRGPNLES